MRSGLRFIPWMITGLQQPTQRPGEIRVGVGGRGLLRLRERENWTHARLFSPTSCWNDERLECAAIAANQRKEKETRLAADLIAGQKGSNGPAFHRAHKWTPRLAVALPAQQPITWGGVSSEGLPVMKRRRPLYLKCCWLCCNWSPRVFTSDDSTARLMRRKETHASKMAVSSQLLLPPPPTPAPFPHLLLWHFIRGCRIMRLSSPNTRRNRRLAAPRGRTPLGGFVLCSSFFFVVVFFFLHHFLGAVREPQASPRGKSKQDPASSFPFPQSCVEMWTETLKVCAQRELVCLETNFGL